MRDRSVSGSGGRVFSGSVLLSLALVGCGEEIQCGRGFAGMDGACVPTYGSRGDGRYFAAAPRPAGPAHPRVDPGTGAGESGNSGGELAATAAGALDATELTLVSSWTHGRERGALDALLAIHGANHPDAVVQIVAAPSCPSCDGSMAMLLAGDAPPDAVQVDARRIRELLPWLAPVDGLTRSSDRGPFPSAVVDALSQNGRTYALPVRVDRVNSLFLNRSLFKRHGLFPPRTLYELDALVEHIKNSPEIQAEREGGITPLALGGHPLSRAELLVFDMLFAAVAGPDLYRRFWSGEVDPAIDAEAESAVVETLREALALYCGVRAVDPRAKPPRVLPGASCDGYFNADVFGDDQELGLKLLADGRAAMAPMSGQARGALADGQLAPGVEIAEVRFPGKRTYLFDAEGFALTGSSPNPEPARALLASLGSLEAALVFGSAAMAPPARADIDPASVSAAVSSAYSALLEADGLGVLVPARSGLPGAAMPDLGPKLRESLEEHDMAAVYTYVLAHGRQQRQ